MATWVNRECQADRNRSGGLHGVQSRDPAPHAGRRRPSRRDTYKRNSHDAISDHGPPKRCSA
jgi:hypothetical protein